MIKKSETFLLNISNAKTDKEKFTMALRMIALLMDRVNELEAELKSHEGMLNAHAWESLFGEKEYDEFGRRIR